MWGSMRVEPSYLKPALDENVRYLNQALGVEQSFDMICRKLEYAGRDFALYFVDGFVKDQILNLIMNHLSGLKPEEVGVRAISRLLHTHVGYLEVGTERDMDKIVASVLSGPAVLLVDGCDEALTIDARTYPAREPGEPDTERVVRGARDGFTETLIFNTALTRRRIRDPSLRMEYLSIGARSKTDICLAYLADIADPQRVAAVRGKLKEITVDGLPMADKTIEEFVFGNRWNPYPMVRYTERPDVAAVHLLEGHVLIYTDTSPSVMITPTTFFHHVQHAEEYRQKPVVGAYLRWVRFVGMLISVFLLPIWYLIEQQREIFSGAGHFLVSPEHALIPLIAQFLIAELGIDLLRMAAIHTPSPLATALGLVAAIMMGQVAVEVGLFTHAIILYLSAAAIGTFATPSYEMGLANRLARLTLLAAVFFFHTQGFILGSLFWMLLLVFSKSLNVPYLWPFLPFNGKALWDILVRSSVSGKKSRPSFLTPQDPDRK